MRQATCLLSKVSRLYYQTGRVSIVPNGPYPIETSLDSPHPCSEPARVGHFFCWLDSLDLGYLLWLKGYFPGAMEQQDFACGM